MKNKKARKDPIFVVLLNNTLVKYFDEVILYHI